MRRLPRLLDRVIHWVYMVWCWFRTGHDTVMVSGPCPKTAQLECLWCGWRSRGWDW